MFSSQLPYCCKLIDCLSAKRTQVHYHLNFSTTSRACMYEDLKHLGKLRWEHIPANFKSLFNTEICWLIFMNKWYFSLIYFLTGRNSHAILDRIYKQNCYKIRNKNFPDTEDYFFFRSFVNRTKINKLLWYFCLNCSNSEVSL